jgi:bla regulator protein blaR1
MSLLWLMSFADHLWQSTLFAGIAGVLTLALRGNGARVRHWIWVAASWKFLIPIAMLTALGSHVPWHTTTAPVYPNFNAVIEEVTEPFSVADVSMLAAAKPTFAPVPAVLTALWVCGIFGLSFSWFVRWRRIRLAVRAGKPTDVGIPIRAISSPTLLEPGVFGIRRPVLLLPEGIFDRLPRTQMNAIVTHELCHVQHRDNLIAAIQMFVETVFWFHPLVWWIGKRMIDERERACDEEVVRTLGEPRAYAEAILNVCKLYVESPLACVPGISGSNLKRRIERILNDRVPRRLTRIRKVVLAVAAFSVVSGPVAIGLLHPSLGWAQAQRRSEQNVASLPRFEVASIKHSPLDARPSLRLMPGGGVSASGATLKVLLQTAFDLAGFEVTGWPKWLFDEKFEILAKGGYAGQPSMNQTHLMMQALLADRFQLTYHYETKELPVYVLGVAKGGSKLQESREEDAGLDIFKQPDGSKGEGIRGSVPVGKLTAQRADMDMLATFFKGLTGREVINQTGLRGRYDFRMEWSSESTPSRVPGVADPVPDDPRPSIFTAVQQQLGLTLDASKGPVQILVIDHVEEPSEN